jgi:hypothetical protein
MLVASGAVPLIIAGERASGTPADAGTLATPGCTLSGSALVAGVDVPFRGPFATRVGLGGANLTSFQEPHACLAQSFQQKSDNRNRVVPRLWIKAFILKRQIARRFFKLIQTAESSHP